VPDPTRVFPGLPTDFPSIQSGMHPKLGASLYDSANRTRLGNQLFLQCASFYTAQCVFFHVLLICLVFGIWIYVILRGMMYRSLRRTLADSGAPAGTRTASRVTTY
jgi:hypothetical protein